MDVVVVALPVKTFGGSLKVSWRALVHANDAVFCVRRCGGWAICDLMNSQTEEPLYFSLGCRRRPAENPAGLVRVRR